ncbi:MAG: single-stranded DNA-binding protein [bacterium]
MFGDLNRVELLGNITSDLNVRSTGTGTQVVSFGIATNRRYKQGDEWKEQTDFHNVVVWGNQATSLAQRAHKGTRLFVSGRLTTRSWDDPNNPGKKNYKTEVVSDQLILIDRYEGKGQSMGASANQASEPVDQETPSKPAKTTKAKKEDKGDNPEELIDPNDLPF